MFRFLSMSINHIKTDFRYSNTNFFLLHYNFFMSCHAQYLSFRSDKKNILEFYFAFKDLNKMFSPCDIGHKKLVIFKHSITVCPGGSNPFYIVPYYIKWVTTSWTHSTLLHIYCCILQL